MSDQESAPEYSYFRLPEDDFTAIAAGRLEPRSVDLLLRAERSRRLQLLQHILLTGEQTPAVMGPLGTTATARHLLAAADGQRADAFESLLLNPHTGMWLAHAVRLLEGTVNSQAPAWVHLGAVNCLAVAAGLAAEVPFHIPVPSDRGKIVLPGTAELDLEAGPEQSDHRYGTAYLSSDGLRMVAALGHHRAEIRLPAPTQRSAGWTPIPRLHVSAPGGRALKVALNHRDPMPHRVGLPEPVSLSPVDLDHWQRVLTDAWLLLDADHPQQATALAAGLKTLIPLSTTGQGPSAGSSADGFGAAAIALPATATDLACALIHEFMHSVLNGLMHLVRLSAPEAGDPIYYAPWRDDPRPLPGILHGAYAFSAVTAFWEARRKIDQGPAGRRAELEFAFWRLNTRSVLEQLQGDPHLTSWGSRLVEHLLATAAEWPSQPVAPEAERVAQIATGSHRAAWRAHHLHIDPNWARDSAVAWRSGGEPPPPPAAIVRKDAQAHGLSAIFSLARARYIGAPGALSSELEAAVTREASVADQLLARGRAAEAGQQYLEAIAARPRAAGPWGGVGVALSADTSDHPALRTLREHPERIRALYREIRSSTSTVPDVLDLADWLS